jgi:hypothetical protein
MKKRLMDKMLMEKRIMKVHSQDEKSIGLSSSNHGSDSKS